MNGEVRTKRCWVAYATRERQHLWPIDLPESASVQDALALVREAASDASIPWEDAPVGIFGEPCGRSDIPRDGDRIEIYRPLAQDPKQTRRERVRKLRKPRST
ncbi:MAG TPA: RnfH family protein [Steroidobacteraceae bacterium]|nr:RnfH family protein [Steroidobacteraceae bacterium]